MTRIGTGIPGLCIVGPKVFGDGRGWFMETYSKEAFAAIGIAAAFVQDNHSFPARRGTLRGIHFRNAPMAQAKLVRVVRGAARDASSPLLSGSDCNLVYGAEDMR